MAWMSDNQEHMQAMFDPNILRVAANIDPVLLDDGFAANGVSEFLAPPPKKISAFPENYNSALRPADQLKPPYYGL